LREDKGLKIVALLPFIATQPVIAHAIFSRVLWVQISYFYTKDK
jgi:hypothetical protein